ncbi:MAG: helix-turn-helix transcriptional regulator [Clostridia bacterium]|nr:helix-turn-helix transcriptional regulator [Clostridia bacterium]
MEYIKVKLKSDVEIDSVISLHYFEYAKDFAFSGEIHDFWEFVYADKDEVIVTAGGNEFLLKAKQFFLHKPMEFHNIRCNGETAASTVIVSFASDSPALYNISGKILECDADERKLMASIINEAKHAFSTPLGDPYTAELIRYQDQKFASEQLIKNYIEILLIHLIRQNEGLKNEIISAKETHDPKLSRILSYLESNVENIISFSDVCEEFSISPSSLKKLFKNEVGCGVMEYYNRCQIDRAKKFIREGNMNFTQISERLKFISVQYFTRAFKNHTGMTPSAYKHSVFSMMENK